VVLAIALVSLSVACRSAGVPEPAATPAPSAPALLGYSGMAQALFPPVVEQSDHHGLWQV